MPPAAQALVSVWASVQAPAGGQRTESFLVGAAAFLPTGTIDTFMNCHIMKVWP